MSILISLFDYACKHPDAIILASGLYSYRRQKKQELIIGLQTKALSEILNANNISILKRNPLERHKHETQTALDRTPDPAKKEELQKELKSLQSDLDETTNQIIYVMESQILVLKHIGSSKIKNWINEKIKSSLNGFSPWLTPTNMDELIFLLRSELGIVGIWGRFSRSVKNWINYS